MLKLAIVGFGSRGQMFAKILQNVKDVKLVAVADIQTINLEKAENFNVPKENRFNSADEFFKQGKICDAIFICSQDSQHRDMAIKAMEIGYDICLEKPVATNIEDCILIRERAKKLNRKVMLTHVLRYAPFYKYLKQIILEGQIGDVVNITATENIAYWHFSLSYVRGPWRNMENSSPTIIAKCCHDLDIIKWLMDKKCKSVSSYGNLYYFRPERAPKGSAEHCVDCAKEVRENCVYNAYKVYPQRMQKSVVGGMARLNGRDIFEVLDGKQDVISRCVFHSENDAIDNQVVNMSFDDGSTASLLMTAFSEDCHRTIAVHGTLGEAYGDLDDAKLYVNIFGKERKEIDVNKVMNDQNVDLKGGHGGGDTYLTLDFIDYVTENNPSITRTTLDDSIASHVIGFKAEQSRLNGGVAIELDV